MLRRVIPHVNKMLKLFTVISGFFILTAIYFVFLITKSTKYYLPIRKHIQEHQDDNSFKKTIDWFYNNPIRYVKYIFIDVENEPNVVLKSKKKLRRELIQLKYCFFVLMLEVLLLFSLTKLHSL